MLKARLAEPADLTAILAFDAFPGDRIIEIVESRMLVIDIDGRPQGYISWQKNCCLGNNYINKLMVSEACRGKGMAKQLIAALDTVLAGRVFISAPASDIAANRLLEATSWVRAGELVGLLPLGEAEIFYYRDLWPDQAS